jgi:integrase
MRVQKIREVASRVTMEVAWGEKPEKVTSHLPAIFDLAVETGRRLGAIVNLRYSDLLLDRGPHGSIRWRADSDKQGRESIVPISRRFPLRSPVF